MQDNSEWVIDEYGAAIASIYPPGVARLQAVEGVVAITILDEIERELSQWYGDRRLAM
jgi:hypothetical protein